MAKFKSQDRSSLLTQHVERDPKEVAAVVRAWQQRSESLRWIDFFLDWFLKLERFKSGELLN
jgi:hypothetical protein